MLVNRSLSRRDVDRRVSEDSKELHQKIDSLQQQLEEKDKLITNLKVEQLQSANEMQMTMKKLHDLIAETAVDEEVSFYDRTWISSGPHLITLAE